MSSKLGNDWRTDAIIYDNVKNLYIGIRETNLYIYQGYGCHPMYDSDALQVEQFFIDGEKFTALCSGLITIPVGKVYPYVLTTPATEADSVNNGAYANQIRQVYAEVAARAAGGARGVGHLK